MISYNHSYSNVNNYYTCMNNLIYFLINLIKLQIINDTQHIIDKKHGIIDIIIIIKGDIPIKVLSTVQLLEDISSSVTFIIFIYVLFN